MKWNSIVLTGPESTGKTTLAKKLATHFKTDWVPEFSRTYLNGLTRPYEEKDLLAIARGQVESEDKFLKHSSEKLIFLDTSIEVIKLWSEIKYGRCHPWITESIRARKHGLYLLCRPDIPWKFDPLRENPNNRPAIFDAYKQEFVKQNFNFVEISGTDEKRILNAINYVQSFFHTDSPHA